MTAPRDAAQTYDPPRLVAPRRRALAAILLSGAVAAALAAGGWGLLSASASQPAALPQDAVPQGQVAEVPGGLLRVDAVMPESMAPMQMDKFARSGMNMSGMGMDMAPEGQRRFTVDVSLAAGSGGLEYSAKDFRLSGEGVSQATPLRSQLGDGALPAGSETQGALVFQAPEDAGDLTLSFDGGEPVALELDGSGNGHHAASGHEH